MPNISSNHHSLVNDSPKHSTKKGGGCLRKIALTVGIIIAVLAIVAISSQGWLKTKFLTVLDEQLDKQGIFLTYEASDFNLLRGLVLNDVTLYRDAERSDKVLNLSSIAIGYSPSQLLLNSNSMKVEVGANDSTLTAYHEGEPIVMDQINADLKVQRSGLRIDQLDSHFYGLNLAITGDVEFKAPSKAAPSKPDPDEPPKPEKEKWTIADLDLAPLAALMEAMKIQAQGDLPKLNLNFSAKQGKPLAFDGEFNGKAFSYDQLEIEALKLQFASKEGSEPLVVSVPQVNLAFGGGSLDGSGEFDTGTQIIHLEQFESTLDLAQLAAKAGSAEDLANIQFASLPRITASGEYHLKNPTQSTLTGSAKTDGVALLVSEGESLQLKNVAASFSLSEGNLQIPDLRFQTLGGDVSTALNATPFTKPVGFSGKAEAHNLDLNQITALAGQNTDLPAADEAPPVIRSVALEFKSRADSETLILDIPSFGVAYGEGTLSGSGEFDVKPQMIRVASAQSNLDLMELSARVTGSPPPDNVIFEAPPVINLSGTIPLATPQMADLTGKATCEQGVTIHFPAEKTLLIHHLTTSFTLKEGNLQLPDFVGQTLGGQASVGATLTPFSEPVIFDGKIEAKDLSLDDISRFAKAKADRAGRLNGTFTGKGAPTLTQLEGSGTLNIKEANFVSIPIFNELMPLLSALSGGPWTGKEKGSDLSSTYTLSEGILKSEDISLKGSFFLIDGNTTIDFNKEEVAAKAKATTRGLTNLISEVAGKALEVEASGSFKDFKWKFKNLPINGASSVTDVSKDAVQKLLKESGIQGENAEKLSKMAEDALGKLLGGSKKKKESEKPPTPEEDN